MPGISTWPLWPGFFCHSLVPLIPATVSSLKQSEYLGVNYFHTISLRNKINISLYTFKHIFRGKKKNITFILPIKKKSCEQESLTLSNIQAILSFLIRICRPVWLVPPAHPCPPCLAVWKLFRLDLSRRHWERQRDVLLCDACRLAQSCIWMQTPALPSPSGKPIAMCVHISWNLRELKRNKISHFIFLVSSLTNHIWAMF